MIKAVRRWHEKIADLDRMLPEQGTRLADVHDISVRREHHCDRARLLHMARQVHRSLLTVTSKAIELSGGKIMAVEGKEGVELAIPWQGKLDVFSKKVTII